ncbi:hypothetical protein CEUSTIGMA_g2795.t1 [Chlamydomonas eustigma]|uniref:Cyclin-like domain-containing protein n=1 Tax=Chlamydomonas eustigma TaxID=1157962 RepID=A0A250WX09_9CHLO|nr:hypothetical protein CEUSTIGMA_g2795.t1 [Chlamydomonas eustigma]|eukprot:GAX75351.1 hypothetical protein CEUSTIGMA_g2795.t1 [Chlamydomonas eustigma]
MFTVRSLKRMNFHTFKAQVCKECKSQSSAGMLCNNVDNFYLSDAELDNSPSRQDGIDANTESTLRHYGAELIQKAGILLSCQQAVMVTGQVLLQRFYCKKSLREFNVQKMAAACTFVASKLEECPRRLRDILMVFDRQFKRGSKYERSGIPVLEPATRDYLAAKDTVIRYERELLRAFGFIVHAEHPHNFVINYVHFLGGDNEFMQLAWNILNDSLRTTLCVRFKAEVVACGAIFYAARKMQVALPESVPWWDLFSCSTEQLVEVVKVLHELYLRPKAEYIHVTKEPLAKTVNKTPEAIAELTAEQQLQQPQGAESGVQLETVDIEERVVQSADEKREDEGAQEQEVEKRGVEDDVSEVKKTSAGGEDASSAGRGGTRGERDRDRSRSRSGGSRRSNHRHDSTRRSERSVSPHNRSSREERDGVRESGREDREGGRESGREDSRRYHRREREDWDSRSERKDDERQGSRDRDRERLSSSRSDRHRERK